MNQLKKTKVDVIQNLQHNELNKILMNVSLELDEEIRGLEATVDRIPSVWLEWLDGGMVGLCCLYEGVSYVNRQTPVWSGVNEGNGQMEIDSRLVCQ